MVSIKNTHQSFGNLFTKFSTNRRVWGTQWNQAHRPVAIIKLATHSYLSNLLFDTHTEHSKTVLSYSRLIFFVYALLLTQCFSRFILQPSLSVRGENKKESFFLKENSGTVIKRGIFLFILLKKTCEWPK